MEDRKRNAKLFTTKKSSPLEILFKVKKELPKREFPLCYKTDNKIAFCA